MNYTEGELRQIVHVGLPADVHLGHVDRVMHGLRVMGTRDPRGTLFKIACTNGDIEMVALLWTVCPPTPHAQSIGFGTAYYYGHFWLVRMMIETLHVENWYRVHFSRRDIWRLWKSGKVRREVFAKNRPDFETWIKEGEAEVACAKATLLESTTLPEAVIEYIVDLF